MNGLDITRRVYRRLRMPSQTMLPHKVVLETISEVIARKQLDLALSPQNSYAVKSQWFTPSSTDFELDDIGLSILLPIRVERRAIGSDYETGEYVPMVNYDVLETSVVGAISFYGDPLRMAFRDQTGYVTEQQYRIVYEADFAGLADLSTAIKLPAYFASMLVLESAYELLEQIDDTSQEFLSFVKMVSGRWEIQIADYRRTWEKYVRDFKGKAQIPKRTFLQNRRGPCRTRYFKG